MHAAGDADSDGLEDRIIGAAGKNGSDGGACLIPAQDLAPIDAAAGSVEQKTDRRARVFRFDAQTEARIHTKIAVKIAALPQLALTPALSGHVASSESCETAPTLVQTPQGPVTCQLYTPGPRDKPAHSDEREGR